MVVGGVITWTSIDVWLLWRSSTSYQPLSIQFQNKYSKSTFLERLLVRTSRTPFRSCSRWLLLSGNVTSHAAPRPLGSQRWVNLLLATVHFCCSLFGNRHCEETQFYATTNHSNPIAFDRVWSCPYTRLNFLGAGKHTLFRVPRAHLRSSAGAPV